MTFSDTVKLTDVTLDSDLTMDQHVIQCCQVLSHRGWTTPIHYCHKPQQAASGTEHTGQGDVSSNK